MDRQELTSNHNQNSPLKPNSFEQNKFTHIDSHGNLKMVDISSKQITVRRAIALGKIKMSNQTINDLFSSSLKKGNAVVSSKIAGIQGAKYCSYILPLTHPLKIDVINIHIFHHKENCVCVISDVSVTDKTGAEMEALMATSSTLLNIYDMVKAVEKNAVIEEIKLIYKSGGKSGEFIAPNIIKGYVEKISISKSKGTIKEPVEIGKVIENYGIEGDAHAGNWHRQVSLLAVESIQKMIEKGLNVTYGSFAENIATSGVCLHELAIGSILYIGNEVVLEVTQIGKECHTKCAVYYKAGECIMPKEGVFTKALTTGTVKTGDQILAFQL